MSKTPLISVLLCTVRDDYAFSEHADWTLFDHIKEELEKQTFKNFELVLVDGLRQYREFPSCNFPVKHIAPMSNLWTDNKKVAISTYRNTGLLQASGELVVNMDDTFSLPEEWLQLYATLFKSGINGVATWRDNGDTRLNTAGRFAKRGEVYGFGSYQLSIVKMLNGYDMAFDGSMYLEDVEFGCRLYDAGANMLLFWLPGFKLEAQSGHDSRAISTVEPIVKCCNPAWHLAQECIQAKILPNTTEYYTKERIARLLAPCWLLNANNTCAHHNGNTQCAYIDSALWKDEEILQSFANKSHPIALKLFENPPIIHF